MTKNEKIKLLTGIAKGQLSVTTLQPRRLTQLIGYGAHIPPHLINGAPVTKEDFDSERKAIPIGTPQSVRISYRKQSDVEASLNIKRIKQ